MIPGGGGWTDEAKRLPRLLAGKVEPAGSVRLEAHDDWHGPPAFFSYRGRPSTDLLAEIELSGLRGRGGGGFPTGRKLAAVSAQAGRPVVVVNGVEGEPLSAKDEVLLSRFPHLVIDGAVAVALYLRATKVIVATKPTCVKPLGAALHERHRVRRDPLPVEAVAFPKRFVAGEETSVVRYLNAGPALPAGVPPRPFQKGVEGAPTFLSNAETFAHVALIARHGHEWFRSVGTPSESGSTLLTLAGTIERPGVYEVARGSKLASLLHHAAGASTRARALLVGGFGGAWIGAEHAEEVLVSEESLRSLGGTLGCGLVVILQEGRCGIGESARILSYMAEQSARQCGPCVNGLAAIAEGLGKLASCDAPPSVVARLRSWSDQVSGRGACHHPDGALRLLSSALRVFADDVHSHSVEHRCLEARLRAGQL